MAKTSSERKAEILQPFLIPGFKSPKEIFRSLRNYLAGQFIGATRDDVLLDELLKCLFCKLYLETALTSGEKVHCRTGAIDSYKTVFSKVRKNYPEIYDESAEILLDSKNLPYVIKLLDFSLLDAKSDPIGDAFEVFAGSESRARVGQFFTPRNATDLLVRAVDPKPHERVIDPACGAGGFLASVARYWRIQGMSSPDVSGSARNLYGIEKDDYLAKLARLHVSLLTSGHPNVACGDSLALHNGAKPLSEFFAVGADYDVVLTNPPFGVRIVAASPELLKSFDLARKWQMKSQNARWEPTNEVRSQVPPQVLFIERCLSLLREGGRLGIVLPESVLSNRSYRYVVEYLLERTIIRAVIGMPESLFKTSGKGGTHTKTCLLVATKQKAGCKAREKVFMAEARWCGKDSRAREIPNDDLPEIIRNFESFRNGNGLSSTHLGFEISESQLASKVLCPRYYDPEIHSELAKLKKTHELLTLGDLVDEGYLGICTGDEVGKLVYGSGAIPFIRTSDLSTWEIKVDPKHCVDRSLYLSLKAKQDVKENDILMVKDGTYLIGTCAIITKYDLEIVYQSHLYKIRVLKNPRGLNPYLLLAVLTSPAVQRQVKAKQFTQDIIDSLGERIREIVLPIPKSAALSEKITAMVTKAIGDRVEARELARRASIEVLQEKPL